MTAGPRVAVVGVRRVRQGLGEHFARWLVAAGATVPAIVGRTEASVGEAQALLARHGIAARGYRSLAALAAAEAVDAVVIASPAETHGALLDEALAARLHVLCEKPLVWGGGDPAGEAARHERAFRAAGLVLREHCQWPETIPAFAALHPGALDAPLRTFEMELSPTSRGVAMLVDALSHPVSLLQALTPPGEARVTGLRFSTRAADADALDLAFRFARGGADVAAAVRLRTCAEPPRPAAWSANGRRADRRIDLPAYTMRFADGDRSVPLPDPMRLAVARFVADVAAGRPAAPGRDGIAERLRVVAEVVAAYGSGT